MGHPPVHPSRSVIAFGIILAIGGILFLGMTLIGFAGLVVMRGLQAADLPSATPTPLPSVTPIPATPTPTFSPVTFTPTPPPATPTPTETESARAVGPSGLVTVYPTPISDYLTNPGIGWQEAHDVNNPRIPESTPYRRWNWRDFNPARDIYDWSKIESLCNAAWARGGLCHFGIVMGGRPSAPEDSGAAPPWVRDAGAVFSRTERDGEIATDPDYNNCVWLEAHDLFVNALRAQYDGDPRIFAIDIRSYGRYGEWATGVDDATPETKRHLIAAWVGGQGSHACNNADGSQGTISYNFPGFRSTYVLFTHSWSPDIEWIMASGNPILGVRHDCLGNAGYQQSVERYIGSFTAHNATAPVAFEFCSYASSQAELNLAFDLCKRTMCSVVHDNFGGSGDTQAIMNMTRNIGYRYVLRAFSHPPQARPGETISLVMTWENVGTAPAYRGYVPLVALIDRQGTVAASWEIKSYVPGWMPGSPVEIDGQVMVPNTLAPGTYDLAVALGWSGTLQPVLRLAIAGGDGSGYYHISQMVIR